MRLRQILVLVIALWLAALDVYDALLDGLLSRPHWQRNWGVGKGVTGLLLSSSLVGMAIGAIALSPLADRLARRTVVLGLHCPYDVRHDAVLICRICASLAAARLLTVLASV